MKNYLTFDLEYWYDSEFINDKSQEDFVIEGLNRVKALLDKYDTKATFFVTGKVLEKYPEAVRELSKQGHEIGSHSYEHKMISRLTKETIKSQLQRSKHIIEKSIGKRPMGFRAPSFSISSKDFWIYELLEKMGFKYSSSLFPVNLGLFGSANFPVSPFRPTTKKKIVELPIRPFSFLKIRIPFSNGFLFRLLPSYLIKSFIRHLNKKGEAAVLALHPWEFCPELPRVKTSIIGKIITYYGLKQNASKLENILSTFEFIPIKEGLKDEKF